MGPPHIDPLFCDQVTRQRLGPSSVAVAKSGDVGVRVIGQVERVRLTPEGPAANDSNSQRHSCHFAPPFHRHLPAFARGPFPDRMRYSRGAKPFLYTCGHSKSRPSMMISI